LALFCYRGNQFWHLVAQRLQRMNDIFNGGEENYHVPNGDLRFVPLLEPDPMTDEELMATSGGLDC
jgi:hypothetical protein